MRALLKHQRLQRLALWGKTTAHTLRLIGGGFFILALISGVSWMFGANIEPVAFVLSLLSSLFFSAPSIAKYLVPDRKPIGEMSYEDLLNFLLETDPHKDWKHFSTNLAEEAFLKEDPRLRIRCPAEHGTHNNNFREPWANRHPDPNAHSYWYEYVYDSSLIERFILVSVDGGRATLPIPEIHSLRVPRLRYHVAQIFDSLNTLDSYMQRSGLVVDDTEPPPG